MMHVAQTKGRPSLPRPHPRPLLPLWSCFWLVFSVCAESPAARCGERAGPRALKEAVEDAADVPSGPVPTALRRERRWPNVARA